MVRSKLSLAGFAALALLALTGCGDEKYPGYKAARPTPDYSQGRLPAGGVPGMDPKMIPAKPGGEPGGAPAPAAAPGQR